MSLTRTSLNPNVNKIKIRKTRASPENSLIKILLKILAPTSNSKTPLAYTISRPLNPSFDERVIIFWGIQAISQYSGFKNLSMPNHTKTTANPKRKNILEYLKD